MTGDEIRAARERAGLTQQELGSAVGVTLRTVGNWERGATVPRNRLAAIRAVLADGVPDAPEPGLRSASDAELLAEIARRFAHGGKEKGHGGTAPNRRAEREERVWATEPHPVRPRPGERA